MLTSVRARLTLWYSAVLTLLLAGFAVAAYGFVVELSRSRTDLAVTDAVRQLELELFAERRAHPSTEAAAVEVLRRLHFRTLAFVVFDSGGRLVASSRVSARRFPPEATDHLGRLTSGETATSPMIVEVPDREGGYRAAVVSVTMPDGRFVLGATVSVHYEAEELAEAQRALFVAIPLAVLLAGLSGWLLARRALAPMVAIRERAASIGATNLGERVPIANPDDEVGQLAAVINDLLGRLEHAFARQRQFMADASHELRTPVAVVQHESSLALSRPGRGTEEYEDSLGIIRDAGRRMHIIVDDLLLLARADAGEAPLRRVPLYLDELIADCAKAVRTLAQRRDVTLTTESPEEAPFTGDEALLHRLVLNLLDNAIKYSPRGASVALRLTADGARYRLTVEDTGPGIPAEQQSQVFERFFRVDASRSRGESEAGGAGLGLAIARWIAEAHGGTLALERSTAAGSSFVLTLPIGAYVV